MLITISGIVGSGKTTTARELVELLKSHGVRATHIRFQLLPCFSLLKARTQDERPLEGHVGLEARWTGYRMKRLSARLAIGYALRILAFRAYLWRLRSRDAHVLDRYFYDSFVHFELRRHSERLYFNMLRRMIPRPDLSILLVVSAEAAATRCPNYSQEYLQNVGDAYAKLRGRFVDLIEVRTDVNERAREDLQTAMSILHLDRR